MTNVANGEIELDIKGIRCSEEVIVTYALESRSPAETESAEDAGAALM